jgi:predicted unusual protein kinase regulating ubiquinone biosynthesis (AarF/ABC1/UbiB family)
VCLHVQQKRGAASWRRLTMIHHAAGVAFVQWQAYKRTHGEAAAAVYVTKVLTDLGPAFVKIGQAVSSRPDVVPPLYLKELERLQVRAPES